MATGKRSGSVLGLVASLACVLVAPLTGLLVTALSVRHAFRVAAGADPSEKARVLAEGISEAMNATVLGLVVGGLAVVPAAIFAVRLIRARSSDRSEGDPR